MSEETTNKTNSAEMADTETDINLKTTSNGDAVSWIELELNRKRK